MRNQLHHCILSLTLLGLIACGSEQPEAAEATAPPDPPPTPPTINTETFLASLVDFMEQLSVQFEQIGDAVAVVDTQAAADSVAARFREEFTPAIIDSYDSLLDWLETHVLAMDETQKAEFEASMEKAALEGRLAPAVAAETRFDNSLMRSQQQIQILAARDPQLMAPIEQAMMELGQQLEPMMSDERMLALDRMIDGSPSSSSPQVGSPAWCQQMANTPQAQWTPNDGFAFASHCIGG